MRFRITLRHIFAATTFVAVALSVVLWEPWENPKDRWRARAAFASMERNLSQELLAPDVAEWAGEYLADVKYANLNLTIAPKTGWLLEKNGGGGCFFYSTRNMGRCQSKGNKLDLDAAFPEPVLESSYVPLCVDDCRYLVPVSRLAEFWTVGKSDRKSIDGVFLMRIGVNDDESDGAKSQSFP